MLQKSFFRIKATDKNPLTYGFLKELRSMPSRRRRGNENFSSFESGLDYEN
jgi:hypothetical protein